jgi:hypothetical protein
MKPTVAAELMGLVDDAVQGVAERSRPFRRDLVLESFDRRGPCTQREACRREGDHRHRDER